MAETLKSVRGMNDLLPPDSAKWNYFESRCRELFARYGYQEIRTPILESTDLFSRGIGEATDIVEKEMYTFPDKNERSMTMRPEGTASCVRAYIQHSMHRKEPVTRWFYSGPMFRYEKMQTGRYRQFYQIGVEAYGVAEATVEAEQVAMLYELYSSVGISDLTVLINSVGSGEDRGRYREALTAFAALFKAELCGNCQRRLETNPLRVLDCKVKTCKALLKDSPSILDSLSEASTAHFEQAQEALTSMGVPFTVDARMVRGLDYYTGTVFEIVASTESLGTQSTIVAGGRYDGLVESLGGPSVPAVGFALGVERAILSLDGDPEEYRAKPDVFVVSRGEAAAVAKLGLAAELRAAGLCVEFEHRATSIKSQFKRADKLGSHFVITVGDEELAAETVKLKDMSERTEEEVPRTEVPRLLDRRVKRMTEGGEF
ncbi:MAG: histidine--tRNA ligase [Myxococcales bacterium]|nr:histidine--tRNA ligase [Myxococcales bacterium]